MHLKKVTIFSERFPSREHYPFILDIFQGTESISLDSPVTLLVGENGTGKSTLLEAVCRRCGIHIWRDTARMRYQPSPYEKKFYRYISVEWTNGRVPGSYFSSDLFRDFAEILDEWALADPAQLKYFGGKSLVGQSHGQSLLSFFQSRYRIKGLYFLDEPETALSPRSQLGLVKTVMEAGWRGDAQFLIATHSPILLSCPGAQIYSFDHVPIREIEYEDTEHYQIYKGFMEDRKKYLNKR